MSGFDQLGLFGSSKLEKSEKTVAADDVKFSVTIESSLISTKKFEDIFRKISKDIAELDPRALVQTQVDNCGRPWHEMPFIAVDVETTGLDAALNRVIELALVPFNMPIDVKPYSQLFSVGEPLSSEIVNITGISDDMLRGKPAFKDCLDDWLRLMSKASFVVAYNAKFDRPFLESEMARADRVLPELPWVDPFVFICELDRFKRGKKLADAAKRWGVSLENAHRAAADAQAAGNLLLKLKDAVDSHDLADLLAKQKIWQWRNSHNLAELKRSNTWNNR